MRRFRFSIVPVLAIMVVAGWLGRFEPVAAESAACPSVGSVDLVMTPAIITTNVGEEFDLTLQVQAGNQTVDTVSAFADFDPFVLNVVSITPGSSLPVTLQNAFSNTNGSLDYEAGKLGSPFPSGTFTLATVRFRVLVEAQNSGIAFHCGDPRITDVLRDGSSVLHSTSGAVVDVAPSLAVTLADFSAAQSGEAILITWETNSELNNRGFNLYRGVDPGAPDRQLNDTLIPSQSPGGPGGYIYTWEDRADLVSGTTYYYWVEDVDLNNVATRHDPVSVDYNAPTAIRLIGTQADPNVAAVMFPWLLLAAGSMAVVWGHRWLRGRRKNLTQTSRNRTG